MAKRKGKSAASRELRFGGQKLCFAGKTDTYDDSLDELKKWAREEGARIAKEVDSKTDILIVLDRGATATAKKKTEKLNQQGASILVLSESDYHDRFRPTPEETLALLKQGKNGRTMVDELLQRGKVFRSSVLLDMRGANLKGLDLSDLKLRLMDLEGADLRETKLNTAEAGELKNVRLAKAAGQHFRPNSMVDCNCKDAQLPDMFMGWHSYGSNKAVVGCDFTGANLDDAYFAYSGIDKTSFKRTVLTKVDFHDANLTDVDFTAADLTGASLPSLVCKSNVSFTRATLVDANLSHADLSGADLSKANLTGATLTAADLTAANVSGANFKDAVLIGAKLDGVDVAEAKNLVIPPYTPAKAGKACADLGKVKAERLEVQADVELPEGTVSIRIIADINYGQQPTAAFRLNVGDKEVSDSIEARSLSAALVTQGELWGHGQLQFDTIKTSSQKSKLKGKALRDLAVAALSEVFASAPPTEEQKRAKKKKAKATQDAAKEEILSELRAGKAGVKAFNKREASSLVDNAGLRNEDLSGLKLDGLKSIAFNYINCNFDKASIRKAELRSCDLRKSSFREADLGDSDLSGADLSGCDFSGAKLNKVDLGAAKLDRANFDQANLTGAQLHGASLCGAQLAGAKLRGAKFRGNVFDVKTTFPGNFKILDTFEFTGKGNDPRLSTIKETIDVPDFDTLMNRLETTVEKARLTKALKMLKAERFELFSDVTDDAIVGVVKSQTDPDLVYSCRLTASGEYCCCTQNLNPCGGLRGALCKHLLVLVIGLTKGESLEPKASATWTHASSLRKPLLDKEQMAETLLKYKGAEAGDIDWRPMETVPEDYYAL